MARRQQQRSIQSLFSNRSMIYILCHFGLFFILLLGVFLPWAGFPIFPFPYKCSSSLCSSYYLHSKWHDYSVAQAAKFVAKNGTVIVCTVSYPLLPFLNNWLISVSRHKHQEKVLVIAEDYATLYKVNEKWPGHAVLMSQPLDSQTAHNYGSQGFYNLTCRRPQHLLDILELGYSVMYNDVDMVWLNDPFQYLEGSHDVYFTDDVTTVKPLNESHDLPPLNRYGVTNICSCMIFLRPTNGAKLLMKKWAEEIEAQPWSNSKAKPHDQPAFNRALNKTAHQVDVYLLPQAAFPSGGLYFRNIRWAKNTKEKHVIIHNNYMVGFSRKMKRFQDFGLWLVDDHGLESPLGKLQ
ncbi:hypothetical protein EUTSA_v10015591mg [Eutrema salsugineum]|uniref:Glycosyltransferase n=1 Tax=Eutrema salsugineum TaxID=72664 RepID=V4LMH7_EUTSA|nr:UDP-D-xylose:L-fucose alpha-1,3-D-xylosyltransferase MGP4 [Eutrema salsugineum]ESQ43667.1 hypothetical protein EUTSA_v10015591mg [Eutrema salsugineum]